MTDAVEFARWQTAIENDELYLVDVIFGNGSWWQKHPFERLRFDIPARRDDPETGLLATFYSVEKRALFTVRSEDTFTFRVLDEHGLTELWDASAAQAGRPGQSTFRVRGHGWFRESELSFFMSDAHHSYIIATGWTCLEIVCHEPPEIALLRNVEAIPYDPDEDADLPNLSTSKPLSPT